MAKVKLRTPDEVAKDGFGLPDAMRTLRGFALLSLRIATRAYFSTYKDSHTFHVFAAPDYEPGEKTDHVHSTNYCSLYGQVIVHYQHFAELVCKDALRAEHDLLAIDAGARPELLLKLAKGEKVAAEDYQGLNSVEFSVALARVVELLKAERLDARYRFIAEARPFLQQLNGLRNRLLHRGTFVLRYRALDEFVGAHVLPFVRRAVALPEYAMQGAFWRHKPLRCGVDPVEAIAADWAAGAYDVKKVALLKELGRAAYENPACDDPHFDAVTTQEHARVEHRARVEIEHLDGADVRECPVCGLNSFVLYEDSEQEVDAAGNPCPGARFPYMLRCSGCTLEVDAHFQNPAAYGLAVPDFWT